MMIDWDPLPASQRRVAWEQWFAWHPVTVHGKRKWLTTVWRRRVDYYPAAFHDEGGYEYGNMFDVVKDTGDEHYSSYTEFPRSSLFHG